MEVNTIICGDCLEVMRDWPDNCVDLVLTDTPYGIGKMVSGTMSKQRLHKTRYDKFEDSEEYVRTRVVPAIERCVAIGKRMIITPGSKCLKYYPQWSSFGCFYMPSSKGMQMWGGMDSQPIIYYGKPFDIGKRIHRCSYVLAEQPSCKLHPCSKPINAWSVFVEKRTRPGDLILDPFCGSGTTCVAAKMLGRRYIGIDISSEYCSIARKRLEAVDTGVPVKEQNIGQRALFPIDKENNK